jgi:allophanate hydrolase
MMSSASKANSENTTERITELVVVGAHLQGQPLEHQLTDRGARWVRVTHTAPVYRLYALPTEPPKPGLVRVLHGGVSIECEVWQLSMTAFADFVDAIPSPLTVGRVMLVDGPDIAGFLCEPYAIESAVDISAHGGWRAYLIDRCGRT